MFDCACFHSSVLFHFMVCALASVKIALEICQSTFLLVDFCLLGFPLRSSHSTVGIGVDLNFRRNCPNAIAFVSRKLDRREVEQRLRFVVDDCCLLYGLKAFGSSSQFTRQMIPNRRRRRIAEEIQFIDVLVLIVGHCVRRLGCHQNMIDARCTVQ